MVLDLKSEDPEFKPRSDHSLDLFEVVPGSTPQNKISVPYFFWLVCF